MKLIISLAAVMQTLWTKVLLGVDLQLLMLLLQLIQCKVQTVLIQCKVRHGCLVDSS
jgi:hypothetical protein